MQGLLTANMRASSLLKDSKRRDMTVSGAALCCISRTLFYKSMKTRRVTHITLPSFTSPPFFTPLPPASRG